jgi:thioester reductase-like protein
LSNLIASTEYVSSKQSPTSSERANLTQCRHFPYAIFNPKDPKLWQYFVFDSKAMGIDWRPRGADEYELVIRRKDPEDPDIQTCFYTFPELSEWSTKDIYQPHPTLEDHWIYKGRADDVIVFSNGEKLNPVSIEATVSGHPLVKGAIVVGQERFQAALILEPTPEALPKNEEEATAFINDVWPLIEKANSETVAHGRITKNFVTLSDPAMPFLRAGKGTVQRLGTVRLYSDFIEALYQKAEADGSADVSVTLDLESECTLTESIIGAFETELEVKNLGPDTDFFSAGVDSLKVMTATNLLRSALKKAGIDTTTIAARVIYSHPTPKALATYILSIKGGVADQDDDSKQILESQRLVSKYTENMPKPKTDKQQPSDKDQTVMITGTTGSLGAYMLDQLCQLPSVKKVIALNRDKDGGFSRQHSVNDNRGLTQDFSKVEFLYADLSLPDMSLGKDKYDSLLATVDRVVHNAWPVNFNISVSSFENSIRGVRHLVDFSAAASKHVPIVFVSSIGTVGNWNSSDKVPEVALHDWTLPQMGYGLSKLAGSLILDAAAERSNVPTASVRVGQVAGSRGEKGIWNPQEFIPSLIASSVYLGALPDHLGAQQEIAWTPVEDIAGLILDVAGITTQKSVAEISGYFHGVNPSIADWAHLAPAVKDFYGDGMSIVSLAEWVKRLEASEKESDLPVEKNPAVKLLDTYRGMLAAKEQGQTMRFALERTKSHSPTIREAGPITPALMRNWCRQWAY